MENDTEIKHMALEIFQNDLKVFGPVPSRRLGNSLGINNIPPKVCSYSCRYCQVGKAGKMQIERQEFYPPEALIQEVTGSEFREF